ncbi:MAG: HAD family hydrolase [Pirellulaceae bacterium]|nr:HAD family hydrolase [Pirellulaceae bacterium]
MLRGIVFDLDNTLVDSRLDFDLMRREMGLATELPILETIDRLPPDEAARCREVLHRHELAGAEGATLLPGVAELWPAIQRRGLKYAVATRNSRANAEITLRKFSLGVEIVLTRDCGPVKPDPWPVLHVCRQWQASPDEIVVIGDYRFDIECGRAAGAKTVLLTHAENPAAYPNHERADLVLSSLAEYPRLLAWLDSL